MCLVCPAAESQMIRLILIYCMEVNMKPELGTLYGGQQVTCMTCGGDIKM